MNSMEGVGKLLIIAGLVLVIAGVAVTLLGRVGWPGRLPGDIVIRREGLTIYFPVVTFLLLSLVLTIVLNLVLRLLR